MKNEYDVVIIGAGPGGLECANQLKETKLSVLIIDKKNIIGPKTCAGGLTNLDSNFNIPKEKTREFKEQEIFINKKRYLISLVNPLNTISREDLGIHQLEKIKKCNNITILKETNVSEIKKDSIVTSRGIFYFKYLVGADGSNSLVRKYLGINSKICIGMHYKIKTLTERFIWFFDPKNLKSGYMWVFPHKNHTNIGVYFNPDHVSPKVAKKTLDDFLLSKGYNPSQNEIEASPVNYLYKGCVFGNIFLVGDAAGLASKTTGEGISFALTSGKEVAKKILYPTHKMKDLETVLIIKKRQEKISIMFELFPSMQTTLFKIFIKLMKKKWFQIYFGN